MNKNKHYAQKRSAQSGDKKDQFRTAKTYGRRNAGKKFPKKGNQGTMTREDESLAATNNPEHYMSNPVLVDAAGRVPFTNAIGDRVEYLSHNLLNKITLSPSTPKPLRVNKAVAGIQILETVPGFGQNTDAQSAMNIAMQAYYTWLRQINSGRKNYLGTDLFKYFMAMSSCYSMINWCQRIFGVMRAFNPINKYLAKTLVEAMGVNYDNIAGNLVQFWGKLNLCINKVASFAVPANMDYFAHVSSMYLDIYSDSESIKDQLYMYNPAGFYKYEFDTSEHPVHPEAYLKFYPLHANFDPDALLTETGIFSYLNDMIDRLIQMEDIAVMSGDTLKAYGSGGIITMGQVPYEYRTVFKHDEYVLTQMKNATIVGYNYNFPDLYEDIGRGYLIFDPRLDKVYESAPTSVQIVQDFGIDSDRIMSVDGPDPDPRLVFEYSRLMVTGTLQIDPDDNLHYTMPLSTGADVVFRLHTFRMTYDASGNYTGVDHQYWGATYFNSENSAFNIALIASTVSAFKYHPMLVVAAAPGADPTVLGMLADLFEYSNYAVVSKEALNEIHRIAIYNMLAQKAVAAV